MKPKLHAALLLTVLACAGQAFAQATLARMPSELETRFALSALPPALRAQASVYLLDPASGYQLARRGSNGLECLVQRTAWELADYRDDIYIPLCYDAAGASSYLRVIRDVATLRSQGWQPARLKAEMERRWREKIYVVPSRPGLSYMVGPVMRTVGPPDLAVHTMVMPHVMFYAPDVGNQDIGAVPDLADPASLQYPFVDRQGNDEQSYFIQLMGKSETAAILSTERMLVDELCEYRDLLCVSPHERH